MSIFSFGGLANTWEVFLFFLIPVGGGIPAGVLLSEKREIGWAAMTLIYLLSDIVLAVVFEIILIHIVRFGTKSPFLTKMRQSYATTTQKMIAGYGARPGAFALVMIAFGVDPMAGRTAALAMGHNFYTGWLIAITGDMLFFGVLAVSTICLNNLLGDGTWTAIIVMTCMIVIPMLIRKIRKRKDVPV